MEINNLLLKQLTTMKTTQEDSLYNKVHISYVPNNNFVTRNSDNNQEWTLESALKTITDALVAFLNKEKIMKGVRIASPCIAVVTNLALLVKMDHSIITTPIVVGLLGIHIVAMIDSILNSFSIFNVAFDMIKRYVELAIENHVMPVIRKTKQWITRNSENGQIVHTILSWLKPVMSVLFLTLGFIVPSLNMDEWCRNINTKMTTIDKLHSATSDLANKVLEDLCGLDLYGSNMIIQTRQEMAQEGIELTKTPTEVFIRDLAKRNKLFTYMTRATNLLAEKLPSHNQEKLVRVLSPFNSIINNNIKALSEVVKTIEECTQLPSRPPALGVLLTGPPGVGKSKFSEWSMNAIANNLDLDPAIYSVSKNGDYYDPYIGQHFGIHDEFLYARSDDPIIPSLTKLLSGEYFNMEGAAINNKKQTCEIKMLTLTTNGSDPSGKLLRKIDENAIRAIWDRIARVEVSDPKVTSRHDTTGNKHRKSDFTHLRLRMTVSTEANVGETEYITVTPSEYVLYFSYRIATNILNFCNDNNVDIFPIEKLQAYVDQHKAEFEELSRKLVAAADKESLTREDQEASENVNFIKTQQWIRRNAGGRNFFVVRLEGRGGTGKSTTAFHLANKLSTIFNMPIDNIPHLLDEPNPNPTIHIVDDLLVHTTADLYLSWINKTNPRSIIILCTNLIHPVKRTWTMNKYTDLTNFSESSGIARRLGITGMYKHGRTWDTINPIGSTYVQMQDTIKIGNENYDVGDLVEHVYSKYINFVAQSREIIIVNDSHTIENPDITITAKNFATFCSSLASKIALMKGLTSSRGDFILKLADMGILKEFEAVRSPDTFVINNMTSKADFETNIKTLVSKLCIYRPQTTVVVNILEEGISAGYKNRCLYINQDCFDLQSIIKHSDETIYLPKNGSIHEVTIKDLAWLKAHAEKKGGVHGLTASELDMIHRYIAQDSHLDNLFSYHFNSFKIKKEVKENTDKLLSRYSVLEKCVHFILGLSGIVLTGAGIYHIYKLCTKDDEDAGVYPNKYISYYDALKRCREMYIHGVKRGIKTKDLHESLKSQYGKRVYNECMAELNFEFSNSYQEKGKPSAEVQDYIDSGDWIGLRDHWKLYPNDMPILSRNQITPDMIDFQRSNTIETLCALLEVNTVLLINPTTGGKNFALGTHDTYLISVAHAVADDMNACYIINNGVRHPVTCLWLDRKRDVAIFSIVKRTHQFKDIRHHFGTTDLLDKTREGYFLRTIHQNRTIAACAIRYTAKRKNPLRDGSDYFEPDEGLFTVLFATAERPVFLKSGDCGLPLVVKTSEGLRIVGIHNAITMTNMAFFASVSKEDFMLISEDNQPQRNTHIFHFHKPATPFTTHELYKQESECEMLTPYVPACGLIVEGYNKNLRTPSFPRDTHRELINKELREQWGLKLPTLPSALVFKPGVMSDAKLVKDKSGKPHTLWTQAVKYAKKNPLYRQWDENVYMKTLLIIKDRVSRDYGKARFMNLHENINGNEEMTNRSWDMTTSAGFLMKKLYNVHTKGPLFENKAPEGVRPYYVFADTEAAKACRRMYEEFCESLENGTPVAIWCRDNRKVELLPADKVKEGKVRLFNELDFPVNLCLKKYFGHILTQVLEKHMDAPYKMGMNIHTESTYYLKKMSAIEGDLISTDISGCDKSMPAEIIRDFCYVFLNGYDPKLIEAIANSLIYTTHVMDGIIYSVDCGNESGSYVTTLLNCFAMEVITIYPVVEKMMARDINPSLQQVEEVMCAMYLGDDRSVKFHKDLGMTEDDLVRCGGYFNFTVTPAKVKSEYISFCSREFIPDQDGIVFPRLKETSVLSCLFWVKRIEVPYIKANIEVALFEAAMHPRPFFNRVRDIVQKIMKQYPEVQNYVYLHEYDEYRYVFKQFIYGEEKSPILLGIGKTDRPEENINAMLDSDPSSTQLQSEIEDNLNKLQISSNTYKTIMDYISILNTQGQKTQDQPTYVFTRTGPMERPTWICKATFKGTTTEGVGATKKLAQQQAAKSIVISNNYIDNSLLEPKLVLELASPQDVLTNKEYFRRYNLEVEMVTLPEGLLRVTLKNKLPICELDYDLEKDGYTIVAERTLYKFVENEIREISEFDIDYLRVKRNNDTPIEPATMNQAAMGQQRSTLPSDTNPQPTAINPAMTHSGDDIMGAITTSLPETLNPVGAPDMLAVGAITFDLKDLIYQQFLDCDTQLVVSDDATEGSIIAQIPYGLHSDYINSYIKYYAKAHERFNGSIQFRFTVIGNPLFSGALGIAWYPRKIKTNTMPISELMKYSYQAEGVTTPWNKIHILHDARREHFYRLVEDEQSDYDSRPHLVLFLMMSLQNPLREGVQTRIRIASKLSNSGEPNPFTFSNPDIFVPSPALTTTVPGLTTNQGSNVPSVFPHTLNIDSNVFTDGTMAAPQVFDFGVPHRNLILNGPLNGARVTRVASSYNATFYQFAQDQTYRLYTNRDMQLGVPILFNVSNVPRKQYNMFANAFGALPANGNKLTTNTKPSEYTGNNPDAFKVQLISFCNDFNVNYRKNQFGIVGLYQSITDSDDPYRFGLFKIITTHGVIVLAIQIIPIAGDLDTTAPQYLDQWGVLPYNQIDIPLNINTIAGNLPSDYKILRISDQPVSAVIINNLTNPTATDDPSISMYYKRVSEGIDSTQCYQFEIQDPVSYRTIAYVRYLQEFGIFVVRAMEDYSYLPQKFSTLMLTTPILVNRTTSFPMTDTTTWLDRGNIKFKQAKLFEFAETVTHVTANSAIAGGMLSGLGAGLSQKSKNKHELTVQGNQLQHEKDMQASDQQYGLKYQKRGFLGQAGLMGINYKSQSSLSKQAFNQSKELAQQQQDFHNQNFNRDLLLSGARAPVSGATSAVSHA